MLHILIKAIEDTGKELGLIDEIQADRKCHYRGKL